MKTKKMTEFSKEGIVAYVINMMNPEIIENHIQKMEEDNSEEWLSMDVLDNDDNSEFPVKVMRVEGTPSGFILIAEEKNEIDLVYQLGQISVDDIDMHKAKELEKSLAEELKKVQKDLEDGAANIEKTTEAVHKTLEEVVKNFKGAAE